MKCRRSLSALLFGIGCALVFVGLIALILPALENPQLRLVLASFSMPSENAFVQAMNRAMRFALTNSWRVVLLGVIAAALGAWLMNYFTPKRKSRPLPPPPVKPETPPVSARPIQSEPKSENPFAVKTAMNPQSIQRTPPPSVVWPVKPILEVNRIKEIEVPEISLMQYDAYHSPRLDKESLAIETEADTASQSGSRMLVRSAYEPPLDELVPAPDDRPEPKPEPPSPAFSTPPAIQTPTPRIRSTMGRHRASAQR